MTDDQLLERLAARQWDRMTRSSTTYDELNEHDQRACRALVAPILEDLRDLGLVPQPDACPVCGDPVETIEVRALCEFEPTSISCHVCHPTPPDRPAPLPDPVIPSP